MGDIPDTVTIHLCDEHMGLLDEKLKPLRDRAQQLEQRVEELEEALRYAKEADKNGEYGIDWDMVSVIAKQEESLNDR